MSVRKRVWTTNKGFEKEAWIVDYVDGAGKRRLKTFSRKKDADVFAATTHVEIREGTHIADSASITVKDAGELWIKNGEAAGLERTTTDQYRQHLNLHIVPFIGRMLLPKLTMPAVRSFEDKLREESRSPAMVKRVIGSLGALLADAQERGLVARNAVRDVRRGRKRGKERHAERRQRGKLRVGVDIPTREEVRAIIENVQGRWRPLLITAIFTGLRASELRGLRWCDVDLENREIHVRQRADRYQVIGMPKSEAGQRMVPLPPMVVTTLNEWRMACPKSDRGQQEGAACEELDLLFPNGAGKVEWHPNIVKRGLIPPQLAAGITVAFGRNEQDGNPVFRAKYTGLHALRHFYASWCINRRADGGLELPAKMVQERLGHSSIMMTMDVYGHLFPRKNDAEELAAAERELMST